MDALLDENQAVLDKMGLSVTKNSAGYFLEDIKRKDGSIDLTPLFVGSQGTLGIITEITIETEQFNPIKRKKQKYRTNNRQNVIDNLF